MKNWETYLYSNHITIKQGGGGTEMLNIGWEGVQSDPPPKNCDLAQTGAIFRQEGSGSMSVNSTVVQNVLWSSR